MIRGDLRNSSQGAAISQIGTSSAVPIVPTGVFCPISGRYPVVLPAGMEGRLTEKPITAKKHI